MRAEVEWLTGVIRGGRDFKEHGDPYEFACTFIARGDTAEVIGLSGNLLPTPIAAYRAIRTALEAHGIKNAFWDRARGKRVNVVGR